MTSAIRKPPIMFAAVAPIDLIAVPAVFAILLNLEEAVVASKVFALKSSISIEPF